MDSEPVDDTIDFGDFEDEEGKHDVGIETVLPTTLETSAENLIARGTEALSILDHFVTFQLLLSNLNELLAFLKMRLMECESSAAEFALFVSDDLGPLGVDGGQLAKWIGRLEKTLAELNDPSLLHLSMLKSSPGYLDEMCKRILAPRVRAEKARRTIEVLQAKQAETSEKIVQVQHNLERSSKLAKKLQSQLQDEIGKLYPGRKVNIIGSIAAV